LNGGLPCGTSCPRGGGSGFEDLRSAPVGYVRRVAAVEGEVDETRRNLLKLAAIAGLLGVGVGGAVGGALQYVRPPVVGISSYPRTQLFDVDGSPLTLAKVGGVSPTYMGEYSVATADLYLFNYPLQNEPNFLLNLYPANGLAPSPSNPGATNVPGGIGDHGSIVAYSAICQHLGCPAPALSFYPPGTCPKTFGSLSFYIHCSCHGSTYDVTNAASNLTGPAVLPLPQVVLEADASGNIYATGMTPSSPPVNGHLNTLQGDYGVGSTSQLAGESPVILCDFPT
jgi:Rieske Fe-S protein